MNLVMAGIDYKTSSVDMRGRFSLTSEAAARAGAEIGRVPSVSGCVLLSTCNRTEVYITSMGDSEPDAVSLLCGALGLPDGDYRPYFALREGRTAVMHLMMMTAGLRSQVRGEDQILAQVKQAVAQAREENTCDATLETLFRWAITGAKKVKTLVPLYAVERSVAGKAAEVLARELGELKGRSVLVIGNGETGKLAASLLVKQGCRVTMTKRSYRRGEAVIPEGCGVTPYEDRYEALADCEILLSATASPHFTIRARELLDCGDYPCYIIDLAVPRDIDPEIENLPGIRYWDVDSLGDDGIQYESAAKLIQIREILGEYAAKFERWQNSRYVYINSMTN